MRYVGLFLLRGALVGYGACLGGALFFVTAVFLWSRYGLCPESFASCVAPLSNDMAGIVSLYRSVEEWSTLASLRASCGSEANPKEIAAALRTATTQG